jgi:hypothetical protein
MQRYVRSREETGLVADRLEMSKMTQSRHWRSLLGRQRECPQLQQVTQCEPFIVYDPGPPARGREGKPGNRQ